MKNKYLNRGLLFLAALFSSAAMLAQPVCNQFNYYYSDINYPPSGKQSDIYSVNFTGGNAILTPVKLDLPYGAHIAYNETNNLIYVVNDANGKIATLDPVTGDMTTPVSPAISLSNVTTATVNMTGKLLIGSHNGKIYQVDMNTDPYGVSVYDSGADISGGDIAWTDSGLFLASKPNGYLYSVLPGMSNVLLGYVDDEVTGMAKMADGSNVVVSSRYNPDFLEYDISGSVAQVNSYPAMLNGNPFTLHNGDMTSGCSSFNPSVECDDFQYFFINDNGPDFPNGTVMSGTIVGNDFVLTALFQAGLNGHLAVNKDNGDFYVMRNHRIKTFSSTGTLLNNVQINGLPSRIESAVWIPGDNDSLYVASSSTNKVFKLDPLTGGYSLYASGIPTNGGDLMLSDAGDLYIVERHDNAPSKLYQISGGSATLIADVVSGVNGAAMTSDGGFIMAAGDGGHTFNIYASDGTPGAVLNAVDNLGNSLTINDGDMASGCFSGSQPSESSCTKSLYYTHYTNSSHSELMSLNINPDNSVNHTELANIDYGSTSCAVSPDGNIYIPNRFGHGFFTVWDVTGNQLGGDIDMTDMGGDNIQEVGGATYHNGLLYVNSLNGTVYALDPVTGVAQSEIVHGHDNGSDIEFDQSGDLWLINREDGMLYNLTQGTSFDVGLDNIDGIALLDNGNFAAVNGDNGSTMYEIDQNAQTLTGNTYDLGFSVEYGDLASACIDNQNNDIPGQCNAMEVIDYTEGTTLSGGSIDLNRTDPSQALGAPERTDQLVFVSLGYGGSITLAFNGSVPNGPGDDIEVVETTYNNNSCATYPEYADVYVSVDGVNWSMAKTICRSDNMVDISDAGSFSYVNYVKIVNNDDLSNTHDAFDVDGVVAIHNCEDAPEEDLGAQQVAERPVMSVYPSPTSGPAVIEFTPVKQGKSTLQIIDMSGRVVKTIFDQDVQANEQYRVDFNGSDLPNGVYITKLTTNNEVTIDKIMIAR